MRVLLASVASCVVTLAVVVGISQQKGCNPAPRTEQTQPAPMEQPPAPAPTVNAPAATPEAHSVVWPEKARFAVVSQDGKVVVFMDGRDIVVAKAGVEQYRVKSVKMLDPQLAISPDGKHLAAYCLYRNGVVLWSVEEQRETRFFPHQTGTKFKFEENFLKLIGPYGHNEIAVSVPSSPVHTRAIVSDNGRVVILCGGGLGAIQRDGKEVKRFSTAFFHGLKVNRDGTLLATYDSNQRKVALMDCDLRIFNTIAAFSDTIFKWSRCGRFLGVLNRASKELLVMSKWEGINKLPAKTQTEIDGKVVEHNYEPSDFHWANPDANSEPCVNLKVRDGFEIQWELRNGSWNFNGRGGVFACLDQGFDVDEQGKLTQYAK